MVKKNDNEDNENNDENDNNSMDEESDNILDESINDEDILSQYNEDNNNNSEIFEYAYTNNNNKIEYLTGDNRISCNRLTRYEMVRILGERVKQLILGAKPMIKNYKDFTYEEIAEYELLNNVLPFKIKRILPNNKYELWYLNELSKEHLMNYFQHINVE
jgi:DNA-directed RNA polymerase subunit K/omega